MSLYPNVDAGLEDLKSNLRIDTDDDDKLLKQLVKAAQKTLIGKIGPVVGDFYKENEQFELATIMLTDHFFKTRSATVENTTSVVPPFGVDMIILDLKAEYRVQQTKESDLDAN